MTHMRSVYNLFSYYLLEITRNTVIVANSNRSNIVDDIRHTSIRVNVAVVADVYI